MTQVVLDSKDLAKIDKEFSAESQVWELLKNGASDITEADFVGANEVRVNKMQGFTASQYKRNGDNQRAKIEVKKETIKLKHELWMGYDMDVLDQSENAAYQIENVISEHVRLEWIPTKDKTAVQEIVTSAFADPVDGLQGKTVEETITPKNVLNSFDEAEMYMTDAEIIGQQFIAFVSADVYRSLKNAEGVSRTFTTNLSPAQIQVNGINRTVDTLDGTNIIIQRVSKDRLQVFDDKEINFILVPMNVAKPIEKYNRIDLIPAETDRDGYRDTIKGLNYFDCVVLEKARPAIYVSYTKK